MKNQLNGLYSPLRIGREKKVSKENKGIDVRSQYQRDFDRIIYSSCFRRLQNKTQVFSLPGSNLVHNRLTHSLEVASVGRSLGTIIGKYLAQEYYDFEELDKTERESRDFYNNELPHVIAAACLCHDIGNTAFGHFGEDAISTYFKNNKKLKKDYDFSDEQWEDFINFEGNANSFRLLTRKQNGKPSGLGLTCSTLAAIAKYPCESSAIDRNIVYRKKFGFFQSCVDNFSLVARETNMKPLPVKNKKRRHPSPDDLEKISHKTQENYSVRIVQKMEYQAYYRHPFVWLVEAADDICYNIIDLEDAHRLSIIGFKDCRDLFERLIRDIDFDRWNQSFKYTFNKIKDENEQIAYLRSKAINSLTFKAAKIYQDRFKHIIENKLEHSIFDLIAQESPVIKEIRKFTEDKIYTHPKVRVTQTAGYNVIDYLLDLFIKSILKPKSRRTPFEDNLLDIIPNQFRCDSISDFDYDKVMGVLDFVSGMTDNYATALYRNLKGIEIGMRYQ